MKGGKGGPVGPPDLGGNQIPPIDLNAQGCSMTGVPEKQLGCLLQRHSAHVLFRHAEATDQLGVAEIQLALLSFYCLGGRGGHAACLFATFRKSSSENSSIIFCASNWSPSGTFLISQCPQSLCLVRPASITSILAMR
jgi:hypothetical protein